jgi:transcriptional regulator with XRE-family HTH domain
MKISLQQANAIGQIVRSSRKAQKLRQDDAAGSIGVSENFLGKIERGGETVQWGKLFQVLDGLGIHVLLDVPAHVADYIAAHAPKPQAAAKAKATRANRAGKRNKSGKAPKP